MTVKDFVEKYTATSAEGKYDFIRSCIKNIYIPYATKIDICNKLIETTSRKENINGEKMFCQKTPAKYMLLRLTLINLYTEIEVDMENGLSEFDLLEENDLTEDIICKIPAKEADRFANIISMIEKDCYENERTVFAIVSNISYKIQNVFRTFGKLLGDALNDKDMPEELKEVLEKIRNKGEANEKKPNT